MFAQMRILSRPYSVHITHVDDDETCCEAFQSFKQECTFAWWRFVLWDSLDLLVPFIKAWTTV